MGKEGHHEYRCVEHDVLLRQCRCMGPKDVIKVACPGLQCPGTHERAIKTYWNGQETPCQRVRVIVGDSGAFPLYWARDLVGQEREAVRVEYDGKVMYLDNQDGEGWRKVTEGRGGPGYSHSNLEVERVLSDG